LWILVASCAVGCGTTRENLATQQLLLSDAVDRAVAQIDFSPLAGEKVYLESRFLQEVKGPGFVNANYIISSLRQQLAAAGSLIQDSPDTAEYIVEARVGTLGSDGHDVQYGIPASSSISAAAGLVAGQPVIPVLPEVSLIRMTKDIGAAKIAVFAYHRESRRPAWKSGTKVAQSDSNGRWILGAGPFQTGSIHDGTKLAGDNPGIPGLGPSGKVDDDDDVVRRENAYRETEVFDSRLESNMVRLLPERDQEPPANAYMMALPEPLGTGVQRDTNVQPATVEQPLTDKPSAESASTDVQEP
jgi:hypothetical protein